MVEVIKSATFAAWLDGLTDLKARARIQLRLDRLALGNAGDVKRLTKAVSELRIDYGPGYRVYFTRKGPLVVILLCGGDKRTQDADIKEAIRIAANWGK
ncbi:MAG: type II toxin-antitoxin system RelE/ParE family toxin [Steroidobacteraceae bacterium]|nr:type II toxin-antitoxin system RelE/ParE family toxin [Steroidobacteraceae bacterium]